MKTQWRWWVALGGGLIATVGCSEAAETDVAGGEDADSSASGGFGSTGESSSGGSLGLSSGGSGGGSGGFSEEGSGGSSASTAVPSAGCGLAGRPSGGAVSGTNYVANVPESYDGSTPLPLVLGLHACGNDNTQIQRLTQGTRVAEHFVRLFPKSEANCWNYAQDKGRLDAVLSDFASKICFDQSRVYVTGHSSGAGMAVDLICKGDYEFRGAAPVAAWKACDRVDPIPVMYIQGFADAQRSGKDGKEVVDMFALSNSCSASTTAFTEVSSCKSSFNAKDVAPGCVSYSGCDQALVWCSHNDEGYNATEGRYHGWPCFASNAMADFFLGLN